jgi:hypothetical protein
VNDRLITTLFRNGVIMEKIARSYSGSISAGNAAGSRMPYDGLRR